MKLGAGEERTDPYSLSDLILPIKDIWPFHLDFLSDILYRQGNIF